METTLEDFVNGLPADKQKAMAVYFCQLALPIWVEFASLHKRQLTYRDSVVGLRHSIPSDFLIDALIVGDSEDMESITRMLETFQEPIVALQDMDWELPYAIERCFYAVYNLVQAVAGRQGFYLCLNQAIDALESSGTNNVAELVKKLEGFA